MEVFYHMINPGSDQEKEYLKFLLRKYGYDKTTSHNDFIKDKYKTNSQMKKKTN